MDTSANTRANIVHGHGPVILWIIDAIEFYRACIGLAWGCEAAWVHRQRSQPTRPPPLLRAFIRLHAPTTPGRMGTPTSTLRPSRGSPYPH